MSDAVCVVTNDDNLNSVLQAKGETPNIRSVIVVGESVNGCHSFHEMAKTSTLGVQFFKGSDVDTREHLALLPFSSGTTGIEMRIHPFVFSNEE